jgi:predicted acyltransferase
VSTAAAAPSVPAEPSVRLASLDALRGFDMFWIVGGSSIAAALEKMHAGVLTRFLTTQLTHATWEGFRFYDLIFPLFLFIVGVSMVFSLDRQLATGGRGTVILQVVRRSCLLFALGVFATGGLAKQWPDVALGGVLHRIAACFLLASCIYVFVRSIQGLAVVAAALLVGYWMLLTFVPVPDLRLEKPVVEDIAARIGSTSPAAIAASVPGRVTGSYEEGRNLTNYFDFRFLPGRKAQIYYINEGLLSTLPAVALPLLGAIAALVLKNQALTPRRKLMWLVAGGAACTALGLAWSLQFPLIKRIWSSSFVLLAAGVSVWLLATFYWIVDVHHWQSWCRPFIWIGCNPLTIYILSPIVGFQGLAARLVGGDVKNVLDAHVTGLGGLVVALTGMGLVILFARFLHRRGIFLRV